MPSKRWLTAALATIAVGGASALAMADDASSPAGEPSAAAVTRGIITRMAAPVHPIVIWFGRVGDMILLSSLLDVLHSRYRNPCLLIAAGPWTAEIYQTHADVGHIWCLRRYTPFVFDMTWWRALRRKLRTARLNSSAASMLQMCPAFGRTTSVESGMAR